MKQYNSKKLARLLVVSLVVCVCMVAFGAVNFAAEAQTAAAEGTSVGLGLIAAALSTGIAGIGAGIAVGAGAPAAIGALTEDAKTFGKALIFVALGEGIALYGMLISILILSKI